MRLLTAAIAVLLLTSTAIAQHITSRELRGDGSWRTDGEIQTTSQQWSLNLQRGDHDRITGLITVSDSPLFRLGTVDGTFDGRIISGTITDETGSPAATFTGAVLGGGFAGKYTDRTGETGEWHWAGELPR